MKDWTLMVFLAADNNLGDAAEQKRAQIRAIGETRHASIVLQLDTAAGTQIEVIGRQSGQEGVQNIGPLNTGNQDTLKDFIVRAKEEAPSSRSFLAVNDHGAGLDPDPAGHHPHLAALADNGGNRPVSEIRAELAATSSRLATAIFPRAVLQRAAPQISLRRIADDWTSGDFLDNAEVRDAIAGALPRNKMLDIVGFEACLMNTVEVAYQLRHVARYVIGSQSNIPIEGWQYAPLIRALHPALATANVARTVVSEAVKGARADQYISMSALDLSQAEKLATAISTLAALMQKGLSDTAVFDAIKFAHYLAQPFLSSETVDIVDFCRQLTARTSDPAILDAAFAVENAALAFVVESRTRGVVVTNAHGVSIYFPKRNHIATTYLDLDFAKKTSWAGFLQAYLGKLFAESGGSSGSGHHPPHDENEIDETPGGGGGMLREAPAAQKQM